MGKTRSLIIGAALLLAGCASTGGTTGGGATDQVISQIQAYTRLYCQFEPTIASINTIVAAGVGVLYPAAASIATIANSVGAAICAAPATQSFSRLRGARATRIVTLPNGRRIPVNGTPL